MENNQTTREILEETVQHLTEENQEQTAPETAPAQTLPSEIDLLEAATPAIDEAAKTEEKAQLSDAIGALYAKKQEKLEKSGIKSSADWVEKLSQIEDFIEQKPDKVIKALSQIYGIDTVKQTEPVKTDKPVQPVNPLLAKIKQLDDSIMQMKNMLSQQHQQNKMAGMDADFAAVDDLGNMKYPYYNQVRDYMCEMIKKEPEISPNAAYEKAIWLNQGVRDALIKEKADALLNEKVVEAEKAKKAGFNPSGKGALSPVNQDEQPKTTRQLLEEAVKMYTFS